MIVVLGSNVVAWCVEQQIPASEDVTPAQGVRAFSLRHRRGVGPAKMYLQHMITAARFPSGLAEECAFLQQNAHC